MVILISNHIVCHRELSGTVNAVGVDFTESMLEELLNHMLLSWPLQVVEGGRSNSMVHRGLVRIIVAGTAGLNMLVMTD